MLIFISMIPWHHAALVLIHLIFPIFRPYYELLRDCCFSLVVQLSRVWLFRPHGLQHTRLPSPSPSLSVCLNSYPLCQWCHPTTSSSVTPSPPALNLSQLHGLFQWVISSHQVAKVLELQHQFFQWISRTDFHLDWLVWSYSPGTCKSLLQHHNLKASIFFHTYL